MADNCFRYVGAQYFTFIMAFSGVYSMNFDPSSPHQIYAVVILAMIVVFTAAKIVIVAVRSYLHPISYCEGDGKVKANAVNPEKKVEA